MFANFTHFVGDRVDIERLDEFRPNRDRSLA